MAKKNPSDSPEKAKTHVVLPLRMSIKDVKTLDAAVKRLGFKSRTSFLVEAVAALLRARGDSAADRLSFGKPNGEADPGAEAAAAT